MKRNFWTKRFGNKDGFTIVEAMVALVILSFAVLGIFRIHLSAVKAAAFNDHMASAVLFARSKVETLKGTSFTSITNGSSTDRTTDTTPPADYKGGRGRFIRQWTVSSVTGLNKTKQVRVQVGWDALGDCTTGAITNCEHNVVVESYISAM